MTSPEILSVLALFVAVLAMLSTVWQVSIARKHNRLSVRPFLDWGRNRTPESMLTLELVNHGIGTAIVKKLSLTYGDESFPIERLKLPPVIEGELYKCPLYVRWMVLTPDSPIKVEQVFQLFVCIPLPTDKPQDQDSVIHFMDKVGFIIEYESLYGERFTLTCPQNHFGA